MCSLVDTDDGWILATGLRGQALKAVRGEILNPLDPLFYKAGERIVSKVLREAALRQAEKRGQARKSAGARWGKRDANA
jgi:hypothetical protein